MACEMRATKSPAGLATAGRNSEDVIFIAYHTLRVKNKKRTLGWPRLAGLMSTPEWLKLWPANKYSL